MNILCIFQLRQNLHHSKFDLGLSSMFCLYMFFPHLQVILQISKDTDEICHIFNSVVTLPGEGHISQAKGSSHWTHKTASTSGASRKSRLSPVPLTNWLQIGGSRNSLVGSIDLLELLPELRKSVYLFFITKDVKGYK